VVWQEIEAPESTKEKEREMKSYGIRILVIGAGLLLFGGCKVLDRNVGKLVAIAEKNEIGEGVVGTTGHTVNGHLRITGGFDEDGKYRVKSMDGQISDSVSGRAIYINGTRATKNTINGSRISKSDEAER